MTLYQRFNRWFDWLNARSRVQLMTPYSRNLGNCAEEIYYALLKARRDRKPVMLLYPRPLFWKLRGEIANGALFEVESAHCVPNSGRFAHVAGWLLTVLFFSLRQLYLRGRALWHRAQPSASRNNVFCVIPTIGRAALWLPDRSDRVSGFDWALADRLGWDTQFDEYVPVSLPAALRRTAEETRVAMGLPLDAWFVCLHVREAGFHEDYKAGVHRKTSIESHMLGIKAITDAGGYVVRIGDSTMTWLPPLDRVIDYAHSRFKSELMDVYLIAACRFFVGVNSGPLDVALLFQKPLVLTNLTNWCISFPKREGDLALLKHVYSRSRRRFLSLSEMLEAPFDCQCVWDIHPDYVMVENSPEEIRDVVLERLQRTGDFRCSPLQRDANRKRQQQVRTWLDVPGTFLSPDPFDDLVERYRFAPSAYAKGAFGRAFVEQNWHVSSRNSAEMAEAVS